MLGLYALALAGIGMAVGGVFRTSLAGEVVAFIVIGTFVLDLLVPALKLPDWLREVALTSHLGHPMVGLWDWPGMIACVVIALGGLVLASWGLRRRGRADVGRGGRGGQLGGRARPRGASRGGRPAAAPGVASRVANFRPRSPGGSPCSHVATHHRAPWSGGD